VLIASLSSQHRVPGDDCPLPRMNQHLSSTASRGEKKEKKEKNEMDRLFLLFIVLA
jgi:hypothetical protein